MSGVTEAEKCRAVRQGPFTSARGTWQLYAPRRAFSQHLRAGSFRNCQHGLAANRLRGEPRQLHTHLGLGDTVELHAQSRLVPHCQLALEVVLLPVKNWWASG